MNLFGRIQNGVVVLDEGVSLPDGMRVCVSALPTPHIECKPGQLPLVQGGVPGAVTLTNERIREILEADEVDALKSQWNVPS